MKVLIGLLMTGLLAMSTTLTAQNNGELVIFIQDGRSISQNFKRSSLNGIEKIAKSNNLAIKVIDATDGAPIEVPYTPAIFYKKGEQNILFNGRYNDLDNIEAFAKSKGTQQPAIAKQHNSNLLSHDIGRATMKTTLAIQPLSGKPPKARKFDYEKFQQEAMSALLAGMTAFSPSNKQAIDPRTYHAEFFPEVHRREGVLLIQMKLYSAYDSQNPIFETMLPTGSTWKEWQKAFEKAGNRIERALVAQVSNGINGDGFDMLNKNLPVQTWSAAMSKVYIENKKNFREDAVLTER